MKELEFNIKTFDKSDLFHKDASYSLGWFEIISNGQLYPLFKDKYCMIFISLSDLINDLLKEKKSFEWIGADNGHKILIERRLGTIRMKDNLLDLEFRDKELINAIIKATIGFINDCKSYCPNIINESPFEDLETTLASS